MRAMRPMQTQQRLYVRLHNMTEEQLAEEVQKAKEGKAVSTNPKFEGWSSTLASTSESVVKAEQSEKKPFDVMQKESIEVLKKKEKEGAFPLKDNSGQKDTRV